MLKTEKWLSIKIENKRDKIITSPQKPKNFRKNTTFLNPQSWKKIIEKKTKCF